MEIAPFATEDYFALYEHRVPETLSASDCETMSIGELLATAGGSVEELAAVSLGYTEPAGPLDLREEIARSGAGLAAEDVVVVGAPEEGIYLTMRALLRPGDDVVVLTPCYDSLANVAEHIGARVWRWPLRFEAGGYAVDDELLQELLARRPRLVIVNFPHNPTGFLPGPEEFAGLVDRIADSGAWLFCDEMYRGLELGGAQRLPTAASLSERAIVLSGLSKAQGLPGLRVGWLVLRDPELRDRIVGWKHYTTICSPAPTLHLAGAAVRASEVLTQRCRDIVAGNVALAAAFVGRWDGRFSWRPPRAGSIALVETDHDDTTAACHRLAEEGRVLLLPGSCLGAPAGTVRFGLGRSGFGQALARFEEEVAAGRF